MKSYYRLTHKSKLVCINVWICIADNRVHVPIPARRSATVDDGTGHGAVAQEHASMCRDVHRSGRTVDRALQQRQLCHLLFDESTISCHVQCTSLGVTYWASERFCVQRLFLPRCCRGAAAAAAAAAAGDQEATEMNTVINRRGQSTINQPCEFVSEADFWRRRASMSSWLTQKMSIFTHSSHTGGEYACVHTLCTMCADGSSSSSAPANNVRTSTPITDRTVVVNDTPLLAAPVAVGPPISALSRRAISYTSSALVTRGMSRARLNSNDTPVDKRLAGAAASCASTTTRSSAPCNMSAGRQAMAAVAADGCDAAAATAVVHSTLCGTQSTLVACDSRDMVFTV